MAKVNNNNTEKISCALYSTNKNNLVVVSNNAGAGWQHTIFDPILLPNGEIDRIDWITSSKINIAQDVEPLVTALYPEVKKQISSAVGCPVLSTYRVVLREDLSIALYNDKLPCEVAHYDDKDKSGQTLREYVTNMFGYPDSNKNLTVGFELKDIDPIDNSVSSILNLYDLNSHDPLSKLDPNDKPRLMANVPQVLADSVRKSKLYKDIMNYLKYNDEALNQKGMIIYGVPGTGKTTALKVVAMDLALPIAIITGNPASTVEDILGWIIPNDDPNKAVHWITQWTDVLKVLEVGGIVVFDEANNFSPSVQIALNNIVYGSERFATFQGKTFKVHPKTIFCVTTNFGEQGNNPMNGAFKQRFYPILATEFNAEQYAAYLSNLYPAIDAKALVEYTKFMYQAIDYTRKTFDNLDRYSPDTPALYTRSISQILTMAFTKRSLKQALGDFVFAITHGVEDNKTKTQGFLAHFDKDISAIEQMFFMNKQVLKDAKKALSDLRKIGTPISSKSSGSSTNADDIFNKAANMNSSSADSIMSDLNNLSW